MLAIGAWAILAASLCAGDQGPVGAELSHAQLIEAFFKAYPKINHTFDWIDACIAGKPSPWADFNYAAMLTETVLLGVIGNRFPGQKLEWDAKEMKFPNMPEADRLVEDWMDVPLPKTP